MPDDKPSKHKALGDQAQENFPQFDVKCKQRLTEKNPGTPWLHALHLILISQLTTQFLESKAYTGLQFISFNTKHSHTCTTSSQKLCPETYFLLPAHKIFLSCSKERQRTTSYKHQMLWTITTKPPNTPQTHKTSKILEHESIEIQKKPFNLAQKETNSSKQACAEHTSKIACNRAQSIT